MGLKRENGGQAPYREPAAAGSIPVANESDDWRPGDPNL